MLNSKGGVGSRKQQLWEEIQGEQSRPELQEVTITEEFWLKFGCI